MSEWTRAFPLDALPPGGARLYRDGRLQVAVFRTGDGEVFAVDNRCPHEGYPLIQGALKGCTLTCSWHNFKFDLRDGACLKGDEAVRAFPVRIVDGGVELDLTPPDTSAALPGLWRSLAEALEAHRIGQATRDAVRLIEAGIGAAELAAFVAAWDGERSEWGASHALAVAADVLAWEERYPGPRFAIPLAQLLELAARGAVRRPARPLAPPIDPGDDPVTAGRALRAAVEDEDAPRAEGLLRGALARGWGREVIEPWLLQLCADHFLSFGHRLIYQIKAFNLLEAAGWARAEPILLGHLFGIVNGTREDVLPGWAGFRARVDALDLPSLYACAGSNPRWGGRAELIAALLDGGPAAAIDAVTEALLAGAPLRALADALSLAASERMLRFDVSIDGDPSNQDSWLSVTHIQTYAEAVRHAIARSPGPAVLRLIYFGARFCNHHRALDLAPAKRSPLRPRPGGLEALLAAIDARDTDAALGLGAALLADGRAEEIRAALMDVAISDRFAAPIVSAHVMKNLVVAFEEREATGDDRPALALIRLLAGPLQQRWTHRSALEAVALVTEGRVPRLLAP